MKLTKKIKCRIVRRADYQGTRPSVTISQAEIEKYVTGCDRLSLSTTTSGTRNHIFSENIQNQVKKIESKKLQQHSYRNNQCQNFAGGYEACDGCQSCNISQ